jgi:hypothetical protein
MSMSKFRAIALTASVVFLFSLVATVRADSVHTPPGQQKLDLGALNVLDLSRDDVASLLSEHFSNNNGKHFGFLNSLANANRFANEESADNNTNENENANDGNGNNNSQSKRLPSASPRLITACIMDWRVRVARSWLRFPRRIRSQPACFCWELV